MNATAKRLQKLFQQERDSTLNLKPASECIGELEHQLSELTGSAEWLGLPDDTLFHLYRARTCLQTDRQRALCQEGGDA